jgi:hypothetical protein
MERSGPTNERSGTCEKREERSTEREVGERERSDERASSTINFKISILQTCATIHPRFDFPGASDTVFK